MLANFPPLLSAVHAGMVAPCPQAWILAKLEDVQTKVVVVDSELANKSVTLGGEAVVRDDLGGLRVFALRQILAQLGANYHRVSTPQWPAGSLACCSSQA